MRTLEPAAEAAQGAQRDKFPDCCSICDSRAWGACNSLDEERFGRRAPRWAAATSGIQSHIGLGVQTMDGLALTLPASSCAVNLCMPAADTHEYVPPGSSGVQAGGQLWQEVLRLCLRAARGALPTPLRRTGSTRPLRCWLLWRAPRRLWSALGLESRSAHAAGRRFALLGWCRPRRRPLSCLGPRRLGPWPPLAAAPWAAPGAPWKVRLSAPIARSARACATAPAAAWPRLRSSTLRLRRHCVRLNGRRMKTLPAAARTNRWTRSTLHSGRLRPHRRSCRR